MVNLGEYHSQNSLRHVSVATARETRDSLKRRRSLGVNQKGRRLATFVGKLSPLEVSFITSRWRCVIFAPALLCTQYVSTYGG